MAYDRDRELCSLATRYGVIFVGRTSPDRWPSRHRAHFKNIHRIERHTYDNYCADINFCSSEPWRKHTKKQAKWLSDRAICLSNQGRNEAGWRYNLENDIFRRFRTEVACPDCSARTWRSEIEAFQNERDDSATGWKERRKNRKACSCIGGSGSLDYYEVGTNPLFDERAEEPIVHDPSLICKPPEQRPDRVYGLQPTTNFQILLSKVVANSSPSSRRVTFNRPVRTSPFTKGAEKLLFPFLIIEAKSEMSSNCFMDIERQTALPILALLMLQENLRAELRGIRPESGPLVWFFASRGPQFRVYGAYVRKGSRKIYEIALLWAGSVNFKNNALQLLLIVDYVFDWARDVYRPSILRQLKSIATSRTYDEVDLDYDSDIISMRGDISNRTQSSLLQRPRYRSRSPKHPEDSHPEYDARHAVARHTSPLPHGQRRYGEEQSQRPRASIERQESKPARFLNSDRLFNDSLVRTVREELPYQERNEPIRQDSRMRTVREKSPRQERNEPIRRDIGVKTAREKFPHQERNEPIRQDFRVRTAREKFPHQERNEPIRQDSQIRTAREEFSYQERKEPIKQDLGRGGTREVGTPPIRLARAPPPVRGARAPSQVRGSSVLPPIHGVRAPSSVRGVRAPSINLARASSPIRGVRAPPIHSTRAPPPIRGVRAPPINLARASSPVRGVRAPPIHSVRAPPPIRGVKAPLIR